MNFNLRVVDVEIVGVCDKYLAFTCVVYFQKEKKEIEITIPVKDNNRMKTKEEIEVQLQNEVKKVVKSMISTEKRYSLNYYKGNTYGLSIED